MAMYKFIATGKRAGQTFVLLDQYAFEKGEMIVTGKEAKSIKKVMDFYACKMEKIEEVLDPDQVQPEQVIEDDEDIAA